MLFIGWGSRVWKYDGHQMMSRQCWQTLITENSKYILLREDAMKDWWQAPVSHSLCTSCRVRRNDVYTSHMVSCTLNNHTSLNWQLICICKAFSIFWSLCFLLFCLYARKLLSIFHKSLCFLPCLHLYNVAHISVAKQQYTNLWQTKFVTLPKVSIIYMTCYRACIWDFENSLINLSVCVLSFCNKWIIRQYIWNRSIHRLKTASFCLNILDSVRRKSNTIYIKDITRDNQLDEYWKLST